ncbi:SixA phosphatase family protein [Sulfurimonas sp.]
MKKIYFMRAAKAEGFGIGVSDYERSLRPKGLQELRTIASYLALQNISVNAILSSCSMRAQETLTELDKILDLKAKKQFLQELYYRPYEEAFKIILAQDDEDDALLIIGHYPQLNELINNISKEPVKNIPSMGVVSLLFDIKSWSDIADCKAEVEFVIYPKQFKYYMPRQIRATLAL